MIDSSRIEEALEIVESLLRAAAEFHLPLQGEMQRGALLFFYLLLLSIPRLSSISAQSCQSLLHKFLQSKGTSLEALCPAGFWCDLGWNHLLYGRSADAEECQNRAIRVAQDGEDDIGIAPKARYVLMLAISHQRGREEEALQIRSSLRDELPEFAALESEFGSLEANFSDLDKLRVAYNMAQEKLQMGESVLSEWFTSNLHILVSAQRRYGLLPIEAHLAKIKANESNTHAANTSTPTRQEDSTTSSRAKGKGRRILLPFRRLQESE